MNRPDNAPESLAAIAPPRGFYSEVSSCRVALMLVGKNPGAPMTDESGLYKGQPSRVVADRHLMYVANVFQQRLGDGPSTTFHKNIRRYVSYFLDLPVEEVFDHCVYTNLVKCSSPGERDLLHPLAMQECFGRHFLREVDFFRPRVLVALGREVEKFLRRHSERHGLPVVYLKHPSYYYRKEHEHKKLAEIREELRGYLQQTVTSGSTPRTGAKEPLQNEKSTAAISETDRNQERSRLRDGGFLGAARPSRKANRTIRVLSGDYSFFGKRRDVWDRLRDGMKVEDWCAICAPIFNTPSAGTYLIALYLEKKLIELV